MLQELKYKKHILDLAKADPKKYFKDIQGYERAVEAFNKI